MNEYIPVLEPWVKCSFVQALRLCTGRTAHRGSRGILLYPFMTTALEGGEGSASRPGRSLPPGETQYPLYRRLGGPQGRSGQVRKISPPPGFDPRTVQLVSRYTDYATRPTEPWVTPTKYIYHISTGYKPIFTSLHGTYTIHVFQS
jgi:hypothetical protein